MLDLIKREPVRVYAIAAAVAALVAHYVDFPDALFLAVVAAVLGLSQPVRATVTPEANVVRVDTPEEAFDLLVDGFAEDGEE